jgi:hypothetical protein
MAYQEKEMASEVLQRFMEMEAEIEARGALLDALWHRSDSQWSQHAHKRYSQILNSQETQERIAEFQSASIAASDGDSLIRALHSEILRRASVS